MMNKVRESNFELLRIVSMIMILVLHFNLSSGFLGYLKINSINYYVFNVLEFISIIAVNLFVLITGYFSIDREIKYKKLLILWLQVAFYSVLILSLLYIFNVIDFNLIIFVKSFFPVLTNKYWFFTSFFGLYLISPFINKFVKTLDEKTYKKLIIILFVIISLLSTLYPENYVLVIYQGYSIAWFIFLYLVSGYIRLYYKDKYSTTKLILLYILALSIHSIIKFAFDNIHGFNIINVYKGSFLNYNNSFVFIFSILIFLIFKNIKIKSKIINYISSSTFSVYLIHSHPELSTQIWKFVDQNSYANSYKAYILLFVSVIVIFSLSIVIDKIRIFIFDILSKTKIIKNINGYISSKI